MLVGLSLRDFVIVDRLEIEFGPGFTALTGETGAGKSILLDALALATGARADAGVVREGASRADIGALFRSTDEIDAWLAERDLTGDPGSVLLRRVIDADGRSRALVNGNPATAALLRELGERLVDVHGQHAAQSLMRSDGQRVLLDAFADTEPQTRALGAAWVEWRALAADLERAESGERDLALERDRLAWQVEEFEKLGMDPGEWDRLNDEQKRLSHAAALIEGTRGAAEALSESDDALASSLHHLQQRLRPLAAIDARLGDAIELLESATIQIEEAASTLSAYADGIDLDPERLAQVEQRIGAIFQAARRMRLAPDEIPEALNGLRAQLTALEAARDIDALRTRVEAAAKRYDALARELSAKRIAAARALAAGVSDRMGELGMAGGRFEIACEVGPPSASGIDLIEFRVAAHAGASPRPLARVASGGELSRIGLAISVMAAQANPVPTLIFDEADA
ncbi:MAG: Recombination protein, partial [Pseudomonadota bacterium]